MGEPGRRKREQDLARLDRGPVVWRPRLVIMLKQPRAGTVKTRLGREIGAAHATSFYRTASGNLLQRLSRDPRWETWLAIAPDAALGWNGWPSKARRIGQGKGDLGHRMQQILDRLPPGPVLIIGTDIPQITAREIALAFARLAHSDAVFGAAMDGGYWCVGLRRSPRIRRIFAGVRWSSEHALADTQANLKGARVAFATALCDVDDTESYRRLAGAGSCVVRPMQFRPRS